jgi:hypothetical protein
LKRMIMKFRGSTRRWMSTHSQNGSTTGRDTGSPTGLQTYAWKLY